MDPSKKLCSFCFGCHEDVRNQFVHFLDVDDDVPQRREPTHRAPWDDQCMKRGSMYNILSSYIAGENQCMRRDSSNVVEEKMNI